VAASLTYQVLDELELASRSSGDCPASVGFEARSLGPLIQLQRSANRDAISQRVTVNREDLAEAASFVDDPKQIYVNNSGSLALASTAAGDDAVVELMQRGLIAINRTAFPRAEASQAVSALGEFHSNVEEHSGALQTGVVGFEVTRSFVGLYASDLGQGVLNSLRVNSRYADLDDSGEALRLALQEGVSSSDEPGRGKGFRPIFVGLASLCAILRFRSGDALLEIDGYSRATPLQSLKERAPTAGFHVYVHCTFG
jgi:hypothetical protein